jgi:cytochrome c551/c552
MKSKLLFLLLLTVTLAHAAPPVEEGKTIFTTRCAGCHNVNKQVLGPALAGIDQRRSLDWIVNFVQSSQALVKSGDKDAVALFKQFNNIPMPDHKDLSKTQIENVVEFIKAEAGAAQKKEPAKEAKEVAPVSLLQVIAKDPALVFTFSVLAILLVSVVLFAYKVKQYQRQMASAK